MQFYQIEPWVIPSTSYIEAWVVQKITRFWTPSGKIIFPCGHSSRRTTSPSVYQIQYPQYWVKKIKHGKTHSLLNNQHTKHRIIITSTSTHQSTSHRLPKGRYNLTKLEDLPSNQAVGTNIWWSYMHMTPMLFLSNLFWIHSGNQSYKLTKKSSSTSQREVSSQDFKE